MRKKHGLREVSKMVIAFGLRDNINQKSLSFRKKQITTSLKMDGYKIRSVYVSKANYYCIHSNNCSSYCDCMTKVPELTLLEKL